MKRIAVTGASGHIAYSFVFRAAHGDLFGKEEPIALHLYDIPGTERAMEGLAMELEDCAFPLLKEIKRGCDLYTLFEGIDLALLIGAKPRTAGMERGDLLLENGKIFVDQGKALNEVAKKDVKVIVVGNPCNTNCLIAMHQAPTLDRKNFHAMMRLDQNRAIAQLAKKGGVGVAEVERMTIWGNHSSTQVPDFIQARINKKSVLEVIQDREWLQNEFIENIQKRGSYIIEARGSSSAASAANALVDAVRSLYIPTPRDDWFTTAVCSDYNPYGIEKNLIFGFPCRSKGDGNYEIISDLSLDFFVKEKIAITQGELISERECVRNYLYGG
jgi:malate dehydrogenase